MLSTHLSRTLTSRWRKNLFRDENSNVRTHLDCLFCVQVQRPIFYPLFSLREVKSINTVHRAHIIIFQSSETQESTYTCTCTYIYIFVVVRTATVIDGAWSSWQPWSGCSSTCVEDGTRSRYRLCDNPRPAGNGQFCDGSGSEQEHCGASSCQGQSA